MVKTLAADRRRALQVVVGGIVAVGLAYFLLDRPIADFASTLHKPVWAKWLTYIADVPVPASAVGLLVGGVAWLAGWRPGHVGRVLLVVCYATLAASAFKDVLKLAAGRPWPETWVGNNPSWIGTHFFGFVPFHGGPGYAAFPSGHTTVVSAPFAVLWRSWPRLWFVWIAPFLLVALGLLVCDYHFLSDCLAGGFVGLGVATAMGKSSLLLSFKKEDSSC
jgi:membrane-associated phospholipid phosphatase